MSDSCVRRVFRNTPDDLRPRAVVEVVLMESCSCDSDAEDSHSAIGSRNFGTLDGCSMCDLTAVAAGVLVETSDLVEQIISAIGRIGMAEDEARKIIAKLARRIMDEKMEKKSRGEG